MQNFTGLQYHTLQPVTNTSSTWLKTCMLASGCASTPANIPSTHPECVAPAGPTQGAPQPAPPQPRQPQQQQQQYHTPQPPQPTPAPTVSLTSQGSGQVRGQPRSNQGGQGPSAPQQAPEISTAPQSAQTTATQAAQGIHVFHYHAPLQKVFCQWDLSFATPHDAFQKMQMTSHPGLQYLRAVVPGVKRISPQILLQTFGD